MTNKIRKNNNKLFVNDAKKLPQRCVQTKFNLNKITDVFGQIALAHKLYELLLIPFEKNEIDYDKGAIIKPVDIDETFKIVQTYLMQQYPAHPATELANEWHWRISNNHTIIVTQSNGKDNKKFTEIKLLKMGQIIQTRLFNGK